MKLFALIKENGKTRIITDKYVQAEVNKMVIESMLSFTDEISSNTSINYIVSIDDINSFYNLKEPFSRYVVKCLKEILNYKEKKNKFNIKSFVTYDRCSVDMLMQKIIDYKANIKIDVHNFDYLLKVLNEIKVKNINLLDSTIHKCNGCVDLSPLSCEKVEYIKKPIFDYDFIIDGYQIYQFQEGELSTPFLEKFIVLNCKNLKRYRSFETLFYEQIPEHAKTKIKKITNS